MNRRSFLATITAAVAALFGAPRQLTEISGGNATAIPVLWDVPATTGLNIQADVLAMIAKLQQDRAYGPYTLFVPYDDPDQLIAASLVGARDHNDSRRS